MSWSNVNRFRKTSLELFIMLSRTLNNFPKMGIWNRFCASNFILMDCQWFCDGFLATCLTCRGSLGRFSVQESLLYGSSLSPAFQSNVADSEPHLHQIYLRSGRRQNEMSFSMDVNWLCPILVPLHRSLLTRNSIHNLCLSNIRPWTTKTVTWDNFVYLDL